MIDPPGFQLVWLPVVTKVRVTFWKVEFSSWIWTLFAHVIPGAHTAAAPSEFKVRSGKVVPQVDVGPENWSSPVPVVVAFISSQMSSDPDPVLAAADDGQLTVTVM
jgi:hypothetical protein